MIFNGLVPPFLKSIFLNSTAQVSFRNVLRNGNFNINQRSVSGTVTLAAGAYGHDGWKAGSNGCTYTFSVNTAGDTVVSISAGSLLQVVEGKSYVKNTAYALSWTGTSTAKVYQGTPTGAFAASPVLVTGITVNTNTFVEFSLGTFTCAQLEPGNSPTPFEYRDDEIVRCSTYFQIYWGPAGCIKISGYTAVAGVYSTPFNYPMMRAAPVFTLIGTWTYVGTTAINASVTSPNILSLSVTGANLGMTSATNPANGGFSLSAEI